MRENTLTIKNKLFQSYKNIWWKARKIQNLAKFSRRHEEWSRAYATKKQTEKNGPRKERNQKKQKVLDYVEYYDEI